MTINYGSDKTHKTLSFSSVGVQNVDNCYVTTSQLHTLALKLFFRRLTAKAIGISSKYYMSFKILDFYLLSGQYKWHQCPTK